MRCSETFRLRFYSEFYGLLTFKLKRIENVKKKNLEKNAKGSSLVIIMLLIVWTALSLKNFLFNDLR